jgi:transposase-like protein
MKEQTTIRNVFDEPFKRKVIEEYLATGCAKEHLLNKYGIKGRSAILRWMRAYGIEDIHRRENIKFALPPHLSTFPMSKKSEDVKQLQKRIKELEQQLEDEKLRSEAYSRIIDIAERELKLPIKKKLDAKSSKR